MKSERGYMIGQGAKYCTRCNSETTAINGAKNKRAMKQARGMSYGFLEKK